MKRFATLTAAAAMLAGTFGSTAFAQSTLDTQDSEMTMLTQKVSEALRECDLDDSSIDTLTMAQVAGITIANDSEDGSDKCIRIEAIALGD